MNFDIKIFFLPCQEIYKLNSFPGSVQPIRFIFPNRIKEIGS